MEKLTLLVQISDLHIGGNENGIDPIPRLEAVIESVRALPNQPDAVLVSGDLTDDGAEEGYLLVREMLERLKVPPAHHPGQPRRQGADARGVRPAG